ncbi:MAG: EF-P lysine aminoacylase EpmA [Pseudomonadota bacterium]
MTSAAASWAPTAPLAARRLRATVYAEIRAFFAEREVLEVETPILSRAGNTDPAIESFVTQDAGGPWFLRTSPEFPMKRLLVADGIAVYELGRVFRRGEAGRWHNPEFTMLEWYRPGFDDAALLDETIALAHRVAAGPGMMVPSVTRLSCDELFEGALGLADGCDASTATLNDALRSRGWYDETLDRRNAFDLLLAFAVRERSAPDELLSLHGFPPELAALARIEGGRARRFEVYAGGQELANGYDELTDAGELAARFAAENERRRRARQRQLPRDEHLLAAQAVGLPASAGVALGVDRLLAWIGGSRSLADVINFPGGRA